MRQVIIVLLLAGMLGGCATYGQLVDTVAGPAAKAQVEAMKQREKKGQQYGQMP